MANAMGSLPTTATAPPVTIRETLRPVSVPTETLRIVVPAKPEPAAASPFGPMRKREPKPPVTIPGQRKPADALPPRRPFPAKPTARKPLSRDLVFNRGAYDEAYDSFQRADLYDGHHAELAFGAA